MAKVNNLKRIIVEDFDSDYQDLIRTLSFSINPMLEQVTAAFNKGIDFDNLNQELLTFNTKVDANGIPIIKLEVRTSLKTRLKGAMVISAINLDDSSLLNGAPFIVFEPISGGIKINQITGIVPNKNYSINVVLIG